MQFRHEWKHEITYSDMLALRARLSAVIALDSHAVDGRYDIRSLYFDNLQDKALLEKIDGVNRREKFRIRYYNNDPSYILLEKKSKLNGLCNKQQTPLTQKETQAILSGNEEALSGEEKPLLRELLLKMRIQGLRPKIIVDYVREPFVYAPGNVRITLDHSIRTGMACGDFLKPDCVTLPARGAPIVLEVKWDEFLPSVMRDMVQLPGKHTSAFSKYAACRVYG